MSDNLKEGESPENLHNYVIKRSKFWILPRDERHHWSPRLFVFRNMANLRDLLSYRQKASGDFSGQDHCSDPKTELWPVWLCLSGKLNWIIVIWKLVPARINRNEHGRSMVSLLAPNYERTEQTFDGLSQIAHLSPTVFKFLENPIKNHLELYIFLLFSRRD